MRGAEISAIRAVKAIDSVAKAGILAAMQFYGFTWAAAAGAVVASVFIISTAYGADWPTYRGPNGLGISAEKLALKQWPAAGLKQIWKTPTPTGFGSFTIVGGTAFTVVRRAFEGNSLETCVALDANTGKELWAARLSVCKYDSGGDSGGGGDGPRATPAISDGKAYVFDSRLVLSCLDAKSGNVVWRKDLVKEHNGKVFSWQNSATPVIDGDLLFVAGGGPGESLLALTKNTGAVVWKSQDEKATHATPTLTTIAGVRQIIFFVRSGLVSVAPKTGDVLWRQKFDFTTSTAASPVVSGDLVYCSAGYGVGAGLYRISRSGEQFQVAEVWRKRSELMNHWSTPVLKDEYLYGIYGFKEFGKAPLKCVELLTGKEMWSEPNYGPGNVILIEDKLVVLGDKGQLVLVEATPAAYKEISRMQAVGGKCWTTPAYSNGRIYVRSTTEGACYDASGN
jgi:outer membrane protein assembly factor BamB